MIAVSQLLPEAVPMWLVVALSVAAVAAWVALRIWLSGTMKLPMALAMFVIRAATWTLGFWLLLNWVGRIISFETPWGIGGLAAAGGFAVEVALTLYAFECRTLSRISSVSVATLRAVLILLVVVLLAEPVLSWVKPEVDQRYVAILFDESASMDLTDPQISPTEKLGVARIFIADLPDHPLEPQKTVQELRAAADELRAALSMAKEPQENAGSKAEDAMKGSVATAARIAKAMAAFPAAKLPAEAAATLKRISESLSRDAVLKDVPAKELSARLENACAAVDAAANDVASLEDTINAAYLASLPAADQKVVDEAAAKTRRAIALAALQRGDEKQKPLDILSKKYVPLVYRFSSQATQTTLDGLQEHDPWQPAIQSTNLAGVLEKVRSDVAAGELSGILILSDGRNTADALVEPIKQWLTCQRVPVCSVLAGSTLRPLDGAVEETAPKMIFLGNRATMQAELKLDGMAVGKEVNVDLIRGGKTVDQKKVKVGKEPRQKVELGDQPDKAGLADYDVRLAPVEGERVTQNNHKEVHIQVSEDTTKLLLIDDRPRWESRYIRNLFADRDKSVRLQYLLFHPDSIEGVTPPSVVASANRPAGEVEANLLPANEEEWMQFDAIILGDIPPERLNAETLRILGKFVREHGGRLIISSGINYMPHAYGPPLADMLPVKYPALQGRALSPDPKFTIALTPYGEQHAVLRMDDDPDTSRKIWDSFTEPLWWRHPISEVKPGAEVLAFAMPSPAPAIFRQTDPGQDAAQIAKQRDAFIQNHALMVVQQCEAGAVMFLAFDSTYRLRYWTGDTYHHRFWGQMMRWATSDKLPVGNNLVRFGASDPVYTAPGPVKLRARFKDASGKVATVKEAWVAVYKQETRVARQKLEPLPDSGGMYQVELARLDPARYRATIEVTDPAHADIVKAAVGLESQFVVETPGSQETAELSADPTILTQLAQSTGGVVVSPDRLPDVLERFGQGSRERKNKTTDYLWQWWPFFAIMVCVATAEWLIRKKGGLA